MAEWQFPAGKRTGQNTDKGKWGTIRRERLPGKAKMRQQSQAICETGGQWKRSG